MSDRQSAPAIDPHLANVHWRDLVPLRRWQVIAELLLPLPWLVASLTFAAMGHWLLALPLSFFFYLTGLRVVHNAFHRTLGVSRAGDHAVLLILSLLMLGSMHAVRHNHLEHHRHCLDDDDVEGACARMPWWKAVLLGPLFPLRMHIAALREGSPATRGWILIELTGNCLVILGALGVSGTFPLRYHVISMTIGQCLSAFFCVWTVHHDCDGHGVIARTIRNRLRAIATFEMFYHLEHHLFPAVPTRHLPELARRLDAAQPGLDRLRAF